MLATKWEVIAAVTGLLTALLPPSLGASAPPCSATLMQRGIMSAYRDLSIAENVAVDAESVEKFHQAGEGTSEEGGAARACVLGWVQAQ